MAFKNPVTTLPASAITGQVQGTQLAADAIDGMTITGALIRTAATGLRWALSRGGRSAYIDGYTGDADETDAGGLQVTATKNIPLPANERLRLIVKAPQVANGGASIVLDSATRGLGDVGGTITLDAPFVSATGALVAAGDITGKNGAKMVRAWRNSYGRAAMAAGATHDQTVTFPAGLFVNPPDVLAITTDPRLTFAVLSITTAGCTLRSANYTTASSGAATNTVVAVEVP